MSSIALDQHHLRSPPQHSKEQYNRVLPCNHLVVHSLAMKIYEESMSGSKVGCPFCQRVVECLTTDPSIAMEIFTIMNPHPLPISRGSAFDAFRKG